MRNENDLILQLSYRQIQNINLKMNKHFGMVFNFVTFFTRLLKNLN
jgi:hypothetical protein